MNAPTPPPRILIVEDEAVIAMDMAEQLREFGYEVTGIAASGQVALQLAAAQSPDLVMMDIVIKGDIDGIETARRILKQRDVPVIFLTAWGDTRTIERAKQTAPNGYLMKPFRAGDLRATIEVALHRHALESRLRESEHWLKKTLQHIHDAIVATDALAQVRFVNPAAEGLLGCSAEQAQQQPSATLVRLLEEQADEPLPDPLARALQTRSNIVPRVARLDARGRRCFVDVGAAPIVDDDGRLLGGVLVMRDITRSRMAEIELQRWREHLEQLVRERTAELEAAKGDAERASLAKSAFLASMSHELRTPMNAILGFSELLGLEDLPPQSAQYARHIQQAGDHLLRLIDDLLDLSRIESGTFSVELAPVALAPVLAQAKRLVQPLLTSHEVTLALPSVAAGDTVLADPTRLLQVLVNLMSNAIKYNRPGGRVWVEWREVDGRQRIAVHDNGPGIAEERQSALFRPFERLGAETTGVRGVGIGLAFSKRLAAAMGGELGFRSAPGEGSCFWIDLPAAAAETAQRL